MRFIPSLAAAPSSEPGSALQLAERADGAGVVEQRVVGDVDLDADPSRSRGDRPCESILRADNVVINARFEDVCRS